MTHSPTRLDQPKLVDATAMPSARGTLLRINLICENIRWTFSVINPAWLSRAGDPVTPDQVRMHFLGEVTSVLVFEGVGRVELWSHDALIASFIGENSELMRNSIGGLVTARMA